VHVSRLASCVKTCLKLCPTKKGLCQLAVKMNLRLCVKNQLVRHPPVRANLGLLKSQLRQVGNLSNRSIQKQVPGVNELVAPLDSSVRTLKELRLIRGGLYQLVAKVIYQVSVKHPVVRRLPIWDKLNHLPSCHHQLEHPSS